VIRGAGSCAALILLAACSQAGPDPDPAPVTTGAAVFEKRTLVAAPNGSISLRIEAGEVVLSAGFLRQSPVATVGVPSEVSWAPDSRRFFINDGGGASRSRFRLWSVDARAQARESAAIHEAVIAELGRRNGCDGVSEAEVTTQGLGWSADGGRVHVMAEGRRQTGGCDWTGADSIVAVADVETEGLVEVVEEGEARRRWPTLAWGPVTTP
jgi:hypothetical protein